MVRRLCCDVKDWLGCNRCLQHSSPSSTRRPCTWPVDPCKFPGANGAVRRCHECTVRGRLAPSLDSERTSSVVQGIRKSGVATAWRFKFAAQQSTCEIHPWHEATIGLFSANYLDRTDPKRKALLENPSVNNIYTHGVDSPWLVMRARALGPKSNRASVRNPSCYCAELFVMYSYLNRGIQSRAVVMCRHDAMLHKHNLSTALRL